MDEENPDIGMAIQDQEQQNQQAAPPDRSQNPFSTFFKDPKNVATALIFGAALAQPRQQGHDGMATLLQRAAGAAAFRGALESGSQKIQLQREETAFERAQKEKNTALLERRVGAEEGQVEAEKQRNANMLTDAALQSSTQFGIENMREQLEKQIRMQKPEMSEGDYVKLAMDAVPHFLSTMEFADGTTSEQKMMLATQAAIKSVSLSRNLLKTGSQLVQRPDGLFIDDGKGGMTQVSAPGGKPKPAPIPKPTPAPKPPPFVGPTQEMGMFAPTIPQRVEGFFAGGGARPTAEERDFPTQSFFPQYLRMFREANKTGAGYDREAVGMLGRLGDDQLQTMGMAPEEIASLRRVQKGL